MLRDHAISNQSIERDSAGCFITGKGRQHFYKSGIRKVSRNELSDLLISNYVRKFSIPQFGTKVQFIFRK
jgi:hypothetical protein